MGCRQQRPSWRQFPFPRKEGGRGKGGENRRAVDGPARDEEVIAYLPAQDFVKRAQRL